MEVCLFFLIMSVVSTAIMFVKLEDISYEVGALEYAVVLGTLIINVILYSVVICNFYKII